MPGSRRQSGAPVSCLKSDLGSYVSPSVEMTVNSQFWIANQRWDLWRFIKALPLGVRLRRRRIISGQKGFQIHAPVGPR
jgi:hypothetical protein